MKIVVKKISPETILLYLITFLTIFSTGSARTSTISAMNEYRRNGILLLFLMFPFVLQVVCKKRFNKKIVQMLLILVFYGVFLCTRNIESALHLLFRWTWFVFYYIVALKLFDESVDFLKFIYNIVKWLTIISLFFILFTKTARNASAFQAKKWWR